MTSLGVVRVGTVGTLSSGRLVLVLTVDEHKATVITLPEQFYPGPYDDQGRYIDGEEEQVFTTTPHLSITPVRSEMLGEANTNFISEQKLHVPRAVTRRRAPTPSPPSSGPVQSTPQVVPTPSGPEVTVVGDPKPPYVVKYQQFEDRFTLTLEHVRQHGAGGRDAVIAACLRHPRWANRKPDSARRDVQWFLRELERAGFIK